jgi:tetratricopeptide (TPR) repeat protein
MPSLSTDRENTENSSLGTRLDCWKEIAAYLGRGERTVKRWERDRALPTHRIPGTGRATVYAYTGELDEWLQSRKGNALSLVEEEEELAESAEPSATALDEQDSALDPALPTPPTSFPRPQPRHRRKLAFAAMVVAGVVGAGICAAALRPSGWIFHRIPALLTRSQSKPDPAAVPAVSDSEKSLAHDFYLKGRYEWNQRTPASLNRALDYFTQAVVHDPGYAQAYVGLADTYNLLEEYSTMQENYTYPRAIAAARKAVELDDSLAEAHRALAFAEFWGEWNFVDGEKEFRRAIELNPKDPVAHKWFANAIAEEARYSESLKEIDKAQELDPSSDSVLADKGEMLFLEGRTQEAIDLLKEVERSAPEFRSPHFYLMIIDFTIRNYPEYLEEGKKAAEATNDPTFRDIIAAAQAGYARDGERGLLKDLYAKQREYYRREKMWGAMLAKTCIAMGRRQEALQLLEEAYNRHEGDVLSCFTQPDLLTLKDEPRYKALLKKINFPSPPQKAQPGSL